MWRRFKDLVVRRILGVGDTPKRVAFGVFLGTIVAWTPTIGFQIVLYVAIAALLRANKVAGIPILFISNPLTAVPLYWTCWKVGDWVLNGGGGEADAAHNALMSNVDDANQAAAETHLWHDIWTSEFWERLGETIIDMGVEIWTGSLIIGVSMAIPLYFITLMAVRAYRRARGQP